MKVKRSAFLAVAIAVALAGRVAAAQTASSRAGYSYVREVSGEVTVDSRWNGQVQASRNMPISAGDAIVVSEAGRAEIGLADGNVLYIGGGSRARFTSIRDQQGEEDEFSMVRLEDGSLVLATVGSDERSIPRIDTDDATVYLKPGARARVNYDSNRGTVVVARSGTAEVRTREGSYRVRAGEYLMVHGDEEPDIERGAFSRDRFDLWAADRYESTFDTRSASASYVDEDYSSDVAAMDGYGDWSYNDTYSSYVWRPRVAAGWTPYGNGSWYYTPAGLTWWSYDPWGWYPFHYGNWFLDASFGGWCWSPGYVYSPAWVYWAYSSSYVGWCPVGWYSFYSPWYNNYYRQWGWAGRGGVFLSVHGTFPTRTVDFRGWNFVGSGGLGSNVGRMDVIPGSRIAGRLGQTVAVSSRPIVVPARPGEGREAVQSFVREAPRVIERTATGDPTRMAPVLARERSLPAATVEEMRGHAVVAERGRLAGPGAADIAPRGVVVDRSRTLDFRSQGAAAPGAISRTDPGRSREISSPGAADPGIARSAPNRVEPRTVVRGDGNGVEAARPTAAEDWRGRSRSADPQRPQAPQARQAPQAPMTQRSTEDWRGRSRSADPQRPQAPQAPMTQRSTEDWRSRSSVPPARRVIEGSVPGRRAPDADGQSFRQADPRDSRSYRTRDYRPETAPRMEPRRDAAPPRMDRAPASAPRSAPAPAPHSAPPPAPHRDHN